jgi:hypothetical protein
VRPATPLAIIRASSEEREAHLRMLTLIDQASQGATVWRRLEAGA